MGRHVAFVVVLSLAGPAAGLAGETGPPAFTKRPTAVTQDGKVRIEFAVSRPTDVAVFVEDAGGRIVRHLVAGALGKNPPAPLRPNALDQVVEWDGLADYGKPAGDGPFRVRVALGLGAKYDKVLISDPRTLGGVKSLAVGPDGTVYVVIGCGGTGPTWNGQQMVAFNRDGSYQRMVMPFPANLTLDEVKGFGVMELDGRPVPLLHDVMSRNFYPGGLSPRKAGMAVTRHGVILRLIGGSGGAEGGPARIGALDGRGAASWGDYAGPPLLDLRSVGFADRSAIAVSADARWAYVVGLAQGRKGLAAVYRVRLPDRGPAEVFFGAPEEVGQDETHLGGPPRGLAIDGKGNLLIADTANHRIVVVRERDGQFVKALPVESAPAPPAAGTRPATTQRKPEKAVGASGPDCLAVDPAAGVIYLTRLLGRGDVELLKLSGLDKGEVLARLTLRNSGNPDFPWLMALDAGAKPPVVWMGSDAGRLLRIEDQGDRFGTPEEISNAAVGNAAFLDLSVDRFRKEVYVRGSLGPYWWFRFNEESGELTKVSPGPYPGSAGSQLVAAPDGTLYSPAWPSHLLKFDRDGKPSPWETQPEVIESYRSQHQSLGNNIYVPVSMTYCTHTVGVRADGHVFVFEPDAPSGRPPKMLIEYLPSGRRLPTPVLWKVSDTAVGPKFDPAGNIYIAEQVKVPDALYPPEFAGVVGEVKPGARIEDPLKQNVLMVYGSILKFTPKGGMVAYPSAPRGKTSPQRMDPTGPNPFDGEPNLDPALKSRDVLFYRQYRLGSAAVIGAEWIYTGVSQVGFVPCNCETTRFDVDEFGRVWYPDLARFRVGVLDTNGNPVTHFGGYGNAESMGPQSKDRRLAEPDIAFSWLIGVGATDRYAYMGDSLNRRLLRAELVYAAEATCEVK